MDGLVRYLSKGEHPVEFEPRTEEYGEVKERITDMKFVFVKFMDTEGETELGINVDDKLTDITDADFDKGKGSLHIVGTCELNYHKVRCIADINLKTKKGKGYLELLDEGGKVVKSPIH